MFERERIVDVKKVLLRHAQIEDEEEEVKVDMNYDKVRDALAATDMNTFYGPIKFSEAGNNIAKPMFYRQIQADGSYKNIVSHEDMTLPRKVSY